MVDVEPVTAALAFGGVLAVVSTVPYTLTAIDYRQRDNGLAYLLLVIGVGVWNLMFVAQLLSPDPVVEVFFLGLSVVGAIQSGLGWFLFATTASSTSTVLDRRGVYAAAGILGGLDIVLAVTSPVHAFFWQTAAATDGMGFATIVPGIGYWLHTGLLLALFGAGTGLFADTWRRRTELRFARAYAFAGAATVLAVLGGSVLAPGGFGVAPIVAMSLTTIGWIQASRGRPFAWLRGAR